jgi:hypothetical protein
VARNCAGEGLAGLEAEQQVVFVTAEEAEARHLYDRRVEEVQHLYVVYARRAERGGEFFDEFKEARGVGARQLDAFGRRLLHPQRANHDRRQHDQNPPDLDDDEVGFAGTERDPY